MSNNLYITFQPAHVLDKLPYYAPTANMSYDYTRLASLLGFNPIFCTKCDSVKDFIIRDAATGMAYPEIGIVFRKDNATPLDSVAWLRSMDSGKLDASALAEGECTEYIVRNICAEDIVGVFCDLYSGVWVDNIYDARTYLRSKTRLSDEEAQDAHVAFKTNKAAMSILGEVTGTKAYIIGPHKNPSKFLDKYLWVITNPSRVTDNDLRELKDAVAELLTAV